MEFFSSSDPGIAFTVLSFLLVLSIVVAVHEYGHFIIGRWCGVKVMVFSIGFGPELFGWNDKRGTRWKISAIPLGGYVKFFGDMNAASVPDASLQKQMSKEEFEQTMEGKPVWKRASIVAAGPIANFLLAIAIFTFSLSLYGRQSIAPVVNEIMSGSAAESAGLKPGDTVLFIGDSPIDSFADMQQIVSVSAGVELDFLIDRNGSNLTLNVTPIAGESTDFLGNKQTIGLIGVRNFGNESDRIYESYSIPGAIWEGTKLTWNIIEQTMGYVYRILTGRESGEQLSGPLGIADASGKVASLGFYALLNWVALISVSIGLINLFPIPLLDGGHLLFYAIEAIRGKPVSPKIQGMGAGVGITLVLLLMIYATWNDITRFLSN